MTRDAWLTRAEAAIIAGVSERTIDRMLRSGKLTRHKREGWRHVLINPDELADVMHVVPEQRVRAS